MAPIDLILYCAAIICFALAAFGVPSKVGLEPLGLMFWCLAGVV